MAFKFFIPLLISAHLWAVIEDRYRQIDIEIEDSVDLSVFLEFCEFLLCAFWSFVANAIGSVLLIDKHIFSIMKQASFSVALLFFALNYTNINTSIRTLLSLVLP